MTVDLFCKHCQLKYFEWLLVASEHQKSKHCGGDNYILAQLNKRFWIKGVTKIIKIFRLQCVKCKGWSAKGMNQLMAPIPSFRWTERKRPFSRTAVDYAGPFITSSRRGKQSNKRWLCLFTCMLTRAVHLEMAYGLDTESFLRAFHRFIGRRGIPEIILSDNGTNFVGAAGVLGAEVIKGLAGSFQIHTSRVKWIYNPPASPHFGGVFESMIKIAKRMIVRIFGSASLGDEELETLFIEVEAMMNSRPLCYISKDSRDEEVLTPNHLIRNCFDEEEGIIVEDAGPLIKRWRRIQELAAHFWQRWREEVIPQWRSRQKWRKRDR